MRVFITGIGMLSPLGVGREENWKNILAAKNAAAHIPSQWYDYMDYRSGIWAPLPDIKYKDYGFKTAETIQYDTTTLLALISAQEAFDHAGLELEIANKKRNQFAVANIDKSRLAVIYGTGTGGIRSVLDNYSYHANARIKKSLDAKNTDQLLDEEVNKLFHPNAYSPFVISKSICSSISAGLGIKFSVHGEVKAVVQACSSGTAAIGDAYNLIKSGKYDVIISGGAEQLGDHCGANYHGFDVARTLAMIPEDGDIHQANRPFDKNRSGFLFAQGGAGTLILESEKNLDKRGGTPLAEICGYAETFDASSLMAPDASGEQMENMVRTALDDASIGPEDIDYVNTHGTSTQSNDVVESDVIGRVFGKGVAVNSTKSILGHTIGASGALEAAVCALSMRDNILHQSKNLVAPIADLDFITENREQKISYALSESFSFGGHNTGLVLRNIE